MVLEGKNVVLGVTGSIAAYKACYLIRMLKSRGAGVKAVMTENAGKFIAPLSLSTVSGGPVYTSMFRENPEWDMQHISLAESCDLLLVAPASANAIAKLSLGLADDLLSTLALAVKCPVVIAPAMNDAMYENPATAGNLQNLKKRGVIIVEPEEGELASGKTGKGRLAAIEAISDETEKALYEKTLSGRNILVTAGPTREPVDAVRCISNPSSGKMGYEIAKAAWLRGARVTLISGPADIPPPRGAGLIRVETALQMRAAVFENFTRADAVVMAAAVSDFRPESPSKEKIAKESASRDLKLERNPDILKELGEKKEGRVLAGFSMDTAGHDKKALEKLKSKNLDFVVSNDISAAGAGFGCDTNIISIIDRDGVKKDYPMMRKSEAAGIIMDRVAGLLRRARRPV